MNQRNNHLLGIALFEIYFLGNVMIDLSIYQMVNVDSDSFEKIILKLVLVVVATFIIFFIIVATLFSTFMSSAAHSSYPVLNSMIVKDKQMNPREKWQFMNLIERLSGSTIAVRCLNMFALNRFNFYQFISLSFRNYFLIDGLIKV
jgi:hypothetical protein